MKVFPTRLFYFQGFDPGTEQRTLSGGTSLAGITDVVQTDGGGVVTVQLEDPDLGDADMARAWEAWAARGIKPFIFCLTDAKHQGFGEITTPIGGIPWWEEEDFADTEPHATLTANAALRATTINVDVSKLSGPVNAGIWISIDHATWRHRAYRIEEVLSDNGQIASLLLEMPLREETLTGEPVEFYDPKCVMRREGDMRAPRTLGWAGAQGVRFVEDFSGGYE